jgi:hypothetical protein
LGTLFRIKTLQSFFAVFLVSYYGQALLQLSQLGSEYVFTSLSGWLILLGTLASILYLFIKNTLTLPILILLIHITLWYLTGHNIFGILAIPVLALLAPYAWYFYRYLDFYRMLSAFKIGLPLFGIVFFTSSFVKLFHDPFQLYGATVLSGIFITALGWYKTRTFSIVLNTILSLSITAFLITMGNISGGTFGLFCTAGFSFLYQQPDRITQSKESFLRCGKMKLALLTTFIIFSLSLFNLLTSRSEPEQPHDSTTVQSVDERGSDRELFRLFAP